MKRSTLDNRSEALRRRGGNLRALLTERYGFVAKHVCPGDRVLEVGAGIGVTSEFISQKAQLIVTDVEFNPWIDVVTSGESLPFASASFDKVICIAALHHMHFPLAALREIARVLRPGGQALVLETHSSLLTRLMLKITGHEYLDDKVDPFGPDTCQSHEGNNWNGNNAIGDLIFGDRARFSEAVPGLSVTHHRYSETFLFINSGGVNFKAPYIPLPGFVLAGIARLDRLLGLLAPSIFSISQELILERT